MTATSGCSNQDYLVNIKDAPITIFFRIDSILIPARLTECRVCVFVGLIPVAQW